MVAKKKPAPRKPVPARRVAAGPVRKAAPLQLSAADRARVVELAERTGRSPREVLERALSAYAASVAPSLEALEAPPSAEGPRGRPSAGRRLFLSVDGRPEIELSPGEFVLGSGPQTDLRLDLPLISPRHARILWKKNQPVFEDLRSERGSYRQGRPVDVHPIQDGDEIDLGGFLSVRFRLA